MAKLQKGLQDYFRIPVLLKPIGETSQQSVRKLHQNMQNGMQCLIIDDRYEPLKTQHSKILQKRQKNVPQIIRFMLTDFVNEWSQFEVIYRCRFCVGVFSSEGNLSEEWAKACKTAKEENRKMVGLMILSGSNCNVQGIKEPYIIIPQKLEASEFNDFLEPWLFAILPLIEDHICLLISQLQKEDNGFIVFNKIEEKPEPRTLKKKKRGRCLKICGDFCLILHLIKQAYTFYAEAEEILKKVDDFLWALGCNQGKLACFTTDVTLEGIDKDSALESARVESLSLSKKIKVPQLQTQNYFKILKIYTKISQEFDEMSRDFLIYVLSTFSSSEKFSILTQLAMLYKEAGMIRKHNYMLYLSARIAIDLKPSLVGIILNQILKSGHVKQWPLVNANVIKLLIDNTTDSKEGLLHLGLLESCCSVLTQRDVSITLEALERRNFHEVGLENSETLQIISITCKESEIKPKSNTLARESPVKSSTGFFMNWRRKETVHRFQQQEIINFEIKVRNHMKFPLRCSFRLHFSPQSRTEYHSFYLQPKLNKINLKEKFIDQKELVSLESIECRIFNFVLSKPASLYPPIKLEIYEEYPVFTIQAPQVFKNEESSLFQFPLRITRTKPYINLAKLQLTVSVYYTIEVGYQETTYHLKNYDQQKYLIVLSDYPYEACQDDPTTEIVRISPLRSHKKHIKKIECKLDAIATEDSKYQISTQSTTNFLFQRSIWCELVTITSPLKINFNRNDEKVIQEEYIIKIAVHKKEDDLTPYRISEGKNSYTLSESTSIVVEKVLKKVDRRDSDGKPLLIVFEWCNSTREKECGTIQFQIQSHPIMYLTEKQINFEIEGWNGESRQTVKSMSQLHISYAIGTRSQNYTNLSHSFVIEPRNLPTIKKFIILGKTKIKTKEGPNAIIKNKLKLKLFYEYAQEYLLGIKFEDGAVYWFPCLFAVVS